MQKLNAINNQISLYASKKRLTTNHQRKAETRTKIQLGGILIKSGITDFFSISVGSDLQLDEQEREKVMLLLGALIEMNEKLSLNQTQKEEWALLGGSALADHF